MLLTTPSTIRHEKEKEEIKISNASVGCPSRNERFSCLSIWEPKEAETLSSEYEENTQAMYLLSLPMIH